jgi:glutamyl-tRNA synthetase
MAYPPLRDDEEKFSFAELCEAFRLERINLGGSIFDLAKLDWLNGRYIRDDLSNDDLLDHLRRWFLNEQYLGEMIPLLQPRMETLGDFVPKVAFFFARRVEVPLDDLVPRKRTAEEVLVMLQTAIWALERVTPWHRDGVEHALRSVAEYWEWPVRDVTVPLIAAVSGARVGPPLFESIALLGLDLTRMRLIDAMHALGGLSKKREKRLEKEWGSRSSDTGPDLPGAPTD